MIKETKNQRFKRVAEKRTQKVLRELRVLGNCGHKGNYDYSREDIRKIFLEIDRAFKAMKIKFHISKEREFKL